MQAPLLVVPLVARTVLIPVPCVWCACFACMLLVAAAAPAASTGRKFLTKVNANIGNSAVSSSIEEVSRSKYVPGQRLLLILKSLATLWEERPHTDCCCLQKYTITIGHAWMPVRLAMQ